MCEYVVRLTLDIKFTYTIIIVYCCSYTTESQNTILEKGNTFLH